MNPISKGLAIAIIILFVGMSIQSTGTLMSDEDSTPPVTTHTLDPEAPNGLNGWYICNVTVSLNASDDTSGVNSTYYRINGEEWNKYKTPFIVSEEGSDILVEYYSVDNVGNIEDIQSISIDIDKTSPVFIKVEWEILEDEDKYYITFYIEVFDSSSGVDRMEMYINHGIYETSEGGGPEYTFTIEWSITLNNVVFTFVVYDKAGWFIEVDLLLDTFKGFIFGGIENLTTMGKNYIFNAVNLRVIQFLPFSYNVYNSGEKMVSLNPRFKIISEKFIFGYLKILAGKVIVHNQQIGS